MFYEPGAGNHGLPFNPFKSCVVPRPIGWISTLGKDGVANLAPYSQFQNITFDPPIVMFSANEAIDGRSKDSARNARASMEFVWNMATYQLREAVNRTADELPADQDEFLHAGLSKAGSRHVLAPRVAESPIQFECLYLQTVSLPGDGPMGGVDVVFGRVVGIHISDDALTSEGRIDIPRLRPLARCGYYEYTSIDKVFEMRPPESRTQGAGLEGAPEKVVT